MHLSKCAFPSAALNCMPPSLFEMKIITIIVSNNNKPIIPSSGRTEGRQVIIYWVCISVRTRNTSNFLSFQDTCNRSLWRRSLQGCISKTISTKYRKKKKSTGKHKSRSDKTTQESPKKERTPCIF